MAANEAPEGWARTTLGDVGTIVTGNTPPRKDPGNFGTAYPWVKPSDLDKHIAISHAEESLSEKGARLARLLPPGTTLVSCIGNLGKVGFAGTKLATNQQINSVIFHTPAVEPRYGFHYCKTLKEWMEQNASETTITILNKGRFTEAPFLLPPLFEQKRIVAMVEKLLARVNAARERLARVPALLKRFRQSVLAAACSGRLTADWRDPHADDWRDLSLGELITDGPQNGLYKPRSAYGRGTRIVRIDNFYDGTIQPWDQLDQLQLVEKELASYTLRDGDILVNRVNSMPYLGKSGLVRNLDRPCVFESNMMRLAVDSRRVAPEFLIRYLSSGQGLAELRKNAKHAVNQASINQGDVTAVGVPVPPLEEQHEIVRRVEALFGLADTIEQRVTAGRQRADKLTQSVLAKAFRGELVPTEAELARREGRSYEPASTLLERIKAERETVASTKPQHRGRKRKSSHG